MRRRLRRRPAPWKALTPKSTTRKPSGHRLGGLRVVPLGKTGDAWLRAESGIRPRSYRGTRPRFASGTLMSLSDDTAFPHWGAVRVRPRFPDAPSGCQPGRSPQRSKEEAERPGDGCPCVGAEEICGAPPLLSEGRNEGEHRGNHDGGSAGCARHGLDLLIPGRWGRRRCSGCPGRPHTEKVVVLPGGWSVATLPTSALNPAVGVTCSEAS